MRKKMLAAVFKGAGILDVEQIEIPQITEPNQVLLKIRAASICGSDLHALAVPPSQIIKSGIVLGHEFFGTIVEKGSKADNYHVGDQVAVNPSVPCGECWECKHGMENLCNQPQNYGQMRDGGFAEYVIVETSQIYHVPADINPDSAAQTEPLACVMYSLKMTRPLPTDKVLLYGAGPIGLTYIQVLQSFGVKHVAVVAKGTARIEQAKKIGADFVIDVNQVVSMKDALMHRWGCMADLVIDAVGTGPILSESVKLLNSRGRILLFGLNHNAMAQIPPAEITQKELQLVGALGKSFPSAISMITEKRINLEELVSHRIALKDIKLGISLLKNKEATRVIIYPNGNIPN